MLKIEQNKDEIIVRETPVKQWALSVLFALFLANIVSGTDFLHLSWTLGSVAFLFVIFYAQYTNPATTIKINKPGKTVSIRRRSLIKYTFNVYSFNEIDDFINIETTGSSQSPSYQLVMPMKDGTKIDILTAGDSKDSECLAVADLMNLHVFGTSKQLATSKQTPFKLTLFND